MSDLTNKLELTVKRTVGYSESSNKHEFMKGANVGIMKVEELYEAEIKTLKTEADYWKTAYGNIKKDITTVTDIFKFYSE